MEWTAVAGGVLACASLANLLISNRIRGDVAELKLFATEKVAASEDKTRAWVEHKLEGVEGKIEKLEALKAAR